MMFEVVVIVALFVFVTAPGLGVVASYRGWFKTGLAALSLWLAGIVGICIGVGLG